MLEILPVALAPIPGESHHRFHLGDQRIAGVPTLNFRRVGRHSGLLEERRQSTLRLRSGLILRYFLGFNVSFDSLNGSATSRGNIIRA
jgi:hypothetical protein